MFDLFLGTHKQFMSGVNINPLAVKQNFCSGNIRIKRKTASLKMLKCLLGSNNQLVMTKLLLLMLRKTKLNELAEKAGCTHKRL